MIQSGISYFTWISRLIFTKTYPTRFIGITFNIKEGVLAILIAPFLMYIMLVAVSAKAVVFIPTRPELSSVPSLIH